jgi:outer membrane receptor protein involved in Fe transport
MTLTAGQPNCPQNGCNSQELLGLPLLNGNSTFQANSWNTDVQIAEFGQVDFRIVGGLKVTAGIRYSHLEYDFTNTGAGPFYGPATTYSGSHAESPITPKYGVSYQFDSALVYASASKGFRPGGAQIPAATNVCEPDLRALGLTTSPSQYDSDNLWSYELGGKLQFLDNTLHLDASVFKIDWNNIQQEVSLPVCGGGFIDNLGKATSKGFDLAAQFKPNTHLLFGASTGYTNAKFTKTLSVANGVVLVRDGDWIAGAGAPWTANVNAEYSQTLLGKYDGFIRLDERYQSRWPTPDPTAYGYDPGLPPLPEQKQLNAKAGVRFESLEVSLFANNLTNAHSLLALTHDALGSPLYYGIAQTPRTIGVVANYRY